MAEFKETVTTTQDEGIDQLGAQVHQKTRQVNTDVKADSKSVVTNVIWYILGLIEVLLALRFVLKLLGANPNSGFVDFMYSITNILTLPFDNIFGIARTNAGNVTSVFEPSILVAAAVYGLIFWGIVKLLNVNRDSR